jgi:uncharacterized protein YbcC (UPF0753/DUF2309 family)
MSISQTDFAPDVDLADSSVPAPTTVPPIFERSIGTPGQRLVDTIRNVTDTIAPVWPLQDFVAVNPYMGLSDRSFLKARQLLRSVCDCETLMPVSYYQKRFADQTFGLQDVEVAVTEINEQDSLSRLTVKDVRQVLETVEPLNASSTPSSSSRRMRTLTEYVDKQDGTEWTETIREEIGRHCAAYYDEGQATWSNPWQHLPLYQAWKSAAQHDRRLDLLGVSGCCRFIATVPHTAEAAVAFLLMELQMPEELWEPFLMCQAHSIPGWSAWTKRKTDQSRNCVENLDFAGLLAMRLAYDVAVSKAASIRVDWRSVAKVWNISDRSSSGNSDDDSSVRFALLRATEVAFQRQLLDSLSVKSAGVASHDSVRSSDQSLAQMVFCIDVRSERYRRNLESVSTNIQTFGFAGFFGMPIAFRNIDEQQATSQVPALLSPSFVVSEGLRDASTGDDSAVRKRRSAKRLFRKSWKQFQSSAAGCFGFVETSGVAYGWKLFSRSINRKSASGDCRFDGVAARDRDQLGPMLAELEEHGIDLPKQIDLAESALRGIGLTQNFAKLVVFCGHASQGQNNPLQAGLDCGACGGHSGEPNARFAAALLNLPAVREGLADRGIVVPEDTRFVAALHNTTSDGVTFFDTDLLTESQQQELSQLSQKTVEATGLTQLERLPQLKANNAADVLQRTLDWSEIRTEWGLSGNAAFIVAPREVTQSANLDGRSFLHSYDYRNDDGFKVLEQIMTAPMVVGHWINMQYYASTVDNKHYGSGSKTIHNVVGKFGVFSGNGGDLTTGLPWQSIHNGQDYQHEPLRLLSVIAAPKAAVADIIERHKVLEDLIANGWMNLVVLDKGEFHRYTPKLSWQSVETEQPVTNQCSVS